MKHVDFCSFDDKEIGGDIEITFGESETSLEYPDMTVCTLTNIFVSCSYIGYFLR